MKKRILPLLILFVILLGNIVPLTSYAVDSTASLEIVKQSEGNLLVSPGETFAVDFNLKDAANGAKAISGILNYNSEKLEIINSTEAEEGMYLINDNDLEIGAFKLVSYESSDMSKVVFLLSNTSSSLPSGKMFTLRFKVKQGATGTFNMSFSNIKYTDGSTQDTPFSINSTSTLSGKIKTPLTSISIPKNTTLGIGEDETLSVTYLPTDTTDVKEVTWSSNKPDIARVESNGKIVAVAPGEAEITATAKANQSITAKCTVTVTSELKEIALNYSELDMAKNQQKDLIVTYKPGNTTDSKNITWSTYPEGIVSVVSTEQGKATVTALSLGETVITAKSSVDGVAPVTCKVNVTSKLQSISLSETGTIELNKNDEKTLTVTYTPADTTDDKTLTWTSSNGTVASVTNLENGQGKIKALTPGTTTITVSSKMPNVTPVTVTVKVVNHLTGIKIKGGNIDELLPKQSRTLEVEYLPADTTDSKTVTWSSEPSDVVSVNSEGKITALKPGMATIKATCGSKSDVITVKVPEVHITTIAFKETEITINKGQEKATEILYYPKETTDTKSVTYQSSTPDIVSVTPDGIVKGLSAGEGTIIAKSNIEGVADAVLTVHVKVPLTGIRLNKQTVTLNKTETDKLEVILNEADTTDDKTVSFVSLNPNVVEVKPDGTIIAKQGGTAVVRAQVGNYTADCVVTVQVPLTGIEIKDELSLYKGTSETLTVTYLPADTTDKRTVTWTSDNDEVASVDANGKVTAKKAGTAHITAQVGEFTSSPCEVTVTEINLTSIAIDNKIDSLLKGESHQLTVKYLPENTTDEKTVTWSSSDEDVVTVDENGVITGLKAGKATITIKNGEMTDSFEIEIKEIAIEGIEVTNENKTLKPGDTLQLTVDFLPGNATDSKELLYSSSDEDVATVDENGVVRALRTGKAVITVTASNGVQTQMEIEVEAEVVTQEQVAREEAKLDTLSPKTGDINVGLYISLMIFSLAGIIIAKKTKK